MKGLEPFFFGKENGSILPKEDRAILKQHAKADGKNAKINQESHSRQLDF